MDTFEVLLTIVVLSFWVVFPIGIFLSVAHVDKNTDQIVRLDHLRHRPLKKKRARSDVSTPAEDPWQPSYHP